MAESESGRTVRYNFAHVAIPVLALWNKDEFYRKAFSESTCVAYLQSIWEGLEQRLGVEESSQGLVAVISRETGMERLLIEVPEPREMPDALFIDLVASVTQSFVFGKTIEKIRCFTLELGIDAETHAPAFFVCEWKSPYPKPDRENYGRIDPPFAPIFYGLSFIKAISYILSGLVHYSLNGLGEIADTVKLDVNGKFTVERSPKSDLTSELFSCGIMMAENLGDKNNEIFSHWANLQGGLTSRDREMFALAMLHHYHEVKTSGEFVPETIRDCARSLPANTLPRLSKPLTPDVKALFNRLLSG